MQTTLAAGAQRAADNEMRKHVGICAACRLAAVQKRPGKRCDAGQELATAARRAAAELAEQKRLDAAPNPRQAPLFEVTEEYDVPGFHVIDTVRIIQDAP